ncbi:winged helix-turn-helix transcriptional regulator [Sulfitobacter mediterraneus]|uniref:MarR family winged helix-turn-helix transcriptional regulator n=1 Tax=Sulfitobacter mediterraneus TaxID=83219 RepID=UPI0019398775|nr:MarR family winged helix-turn-helix transcriptional regulator [Sulfitobacter mediterraneus]MBM1555652.1 winged helix-turn-helix transcriptional regulator [Sulfitobacter mediterraneus]MBM1566795.1 winged helix-turn-helix transcriptional regulator [Sulfitobacter mediterraneus]MBM1570597.1 winged helix-turn-helix transcriptional regulator [Sulfitobacter mediterraneus]MBM1574397.1 winged helix-turn-helix transcriptional regulator [Sulfitobacter mediterraneus]MBM1578610.1 winged helix-turn-helix
MSDDFNAARGDSVPNGGGMLRSGGKHPDVLTVEDVITFKLRRLVLIGEREGHLWSEDMFDLSLNEWRLLALIKARMPARAGDIADFILMDKSQASRLIKSLQSKGLVVTGEDPDDGRALMLELTSEGDKVYNSMMAEVLRSNEVVLAPLSAEEIVLFSDMLQRLIDHSYDHLEGQIRRGN